LCCKVRRRICTFFFKCEVNREAWNVMGLEHIIYPRLQIFHNVTVNIRCLCQRKQDDNMKNDHVNVGNVESREFSSIGRDITLYVQESRVR
jgi:hypothetical protein